MIEPSEQHYYQPLWTLVGGGVASQKETVRPQASVMPQGVAWIKDAAADMVGCIAVCAAGRAAVATAFSADAAAAKDSRGMASSGAIGDAVVDVIANADDSFLVEDQENPTTGGSPAANAIRPAGLHYDYVVDSRVVAPWAFAEWEFAPDWTATSRARPPG